MATTTGTITPLLTEGIRKIIGDAFKRYPLEFSQYLNVNSSRKNFEFDRETVGVGSLATKAENAPIALLDPLVGREKRYTHQTFAAGISVSWEARADDLYGFINRVFNSLGQAANETMNTEGAGVFNLADSGDTGPLTGFDTLSLLNAAHTHPTGATMAYTSNRLSLDLSETALQTALIQFETIQDAVDNRITFGKPNKLVIAPDNMFLVREILQSEGRPFTADNTTNVLRGIITPVVLHYGTDVDRWLVVAQNHDLNWFMRVAPVMDRYDDKSTKAMVVTIAGRWSRGFGEWRPVIGSPGVP